ncbi:hypothetical protein ABW21_db0208810 [Orbilia brochopaga]|nr:hypothetical protein ABW21_db0208810 [Drechslerella brochopaga]
MRRTQTFGGSSITSRAERAANVISVYPLSTIGGKSERGESQERIVPTSSGSDRTVDVIAGFSPVSPLGPLKEGMVEATRSATWDKRRYGDDKAV